MQSLSIHIFTSYIFMKVWFISFFFHFSAAFSCFCPLVAQIVRPVKYVHVFGIHSTSHKISTCFRKICTYFCCASFCCGYIIIHSRLIWFIYAYPSGLLHWHWGNHMIAPVPVKYSWRVWVKSTGVLFQDVKDLANSWKPSDLYLELYNCSEIWHAPQQQCCWYACQISKQCDN